MGWGLSGIYAHGQAPQVHLLVIGRQVVRVSLHLMLMICLRAVLRLGALTQAK